MSWADSITESTARPTRPTRLAYVPPHLRNNNGVSVTATTFVTTQPFGFTIESSSSGYRFNRSGSRELGRTGQSRGRGRGRGRGRSWGRHREVYDLNPTPTPTANSFGSAEKFDDLEVLEDTLVGGGINFDAYEDIPVETSGSNIPPPVHTFAEIDLGKALNDNIKRCKYVKPTPIQRHAIPIALAGRDLMACAQTGSGKTAAFCFPLICGLLRSHALQPVSSRGVRIAYPLALIMSPTRELSCQIHEEAKKFSHQTGVKVVVAYGGAPISQQFRNLEKGVDILVATPGRLVDMIERARVSLKMIKYLALDEADRMLDMGFEPQIRKIVEQMEMPPPGARQTMLFSATFPTEIQRLASDFLSNYIFLAVGRVGSSTDLIVQRVDFVRDMDKRNHLMNLLHAQRADGTTRKPVLTLVFVETKKGADALERWLSINGFPATTIHGDKVQMERERALRSFKTGVTPILVATDVAARGLDIPHVAHVINFDLPRDINDYVHRIGRTGRAGNSGLATAFFSDKNMPLAKALVELMQEAKQEIPPWLSQYAETSSYGGGVGGGRAHRYGGSKFGGHDYRNVAQFRDANYYHTNAASDYYHTNAASDDYSHAAPVNADYFAAAASSDSYAAAGDDSYAPGSYGYGRDYGSIVASGWE